MVGGRRTYSQVTRHPLVSTAAPARTSAHALCAKVLRIALVFLLAFYSTYYLEVRVALATEVSGDATAQGPSAVAQDGTGSLTGEGDPADSGNAGAGLPVGSPEGESSEGGLVSYAYVKSVQILDTAKNPVDVDENDEKKRRHLKLSFADLQKKTNAESGQDLQDLQESETGASDVQDDGRESEKRGLYGFVARVVVVVDSNTEETATYYCTPSNGLSKQTDGVLNDLTWEICAESEENPDELVAYSDSKDYMSPTHGELLQETEIECYVRCVSEQGRGWAAGKAQFVADDILLTVVSTAEEPDPEPKPDVPAFTVSYDPNGGAGQLEPTLADENGIVVLADPANGFTAPEGMSFAAWTTEPLEPLEPKDTAEDDAAANVQEGAEDVAGDSADSVDDGTGQDGSENADASQAGSNTASGARADESQTHVASYAPGAEVKVDKDTVFYAQWAKSAPSDDGSDSGPSGEEGSDTVLPDDGKTRVSISYSPTPKGQMATLSPVVYGLGHGTFSFLWEVSEDNGATWTIADNPEAAVLLVPTTDENLGKQYRVTLYADRYLDEEGKKNHVVSEPVVLQADNNSFAVTLSYDPVPEDETAFFSVTTSALDATFEWLVSKNGGATWDVIPNATGMTYTVPTTVENLGNWYRVRATGTFEFDAEGARGDDAATVEEGSESSGLADAVGGNADAAGAGSLDAQPGADSAQDAGGAAGDQAETGKKGTSTVLSNIQMLVATVPDAAPIPIDKLSDPDSFNNLQPDIPSPAGENSDTPLIPIDMSAVVPVPSLPSIDSEVYPEENPIEYDASYPDTSGEGQEEAAPVDYSEPSNDGSVPVPVPAPIAENNPSPEQVQPTPAPTPAPAPEATIEPKPAAQEQPVTEDQPEPEAFETAELLGERWHSVSVRPQTAEIEQVLADNPFAGFVVPFVVALLACGMVERYVAFRRQTRPSAAVFA